MIEQACCDQHVTGCLRVKIEFVGGALHAVKLSDFQHFSAHLLPRRDRKTTKNVLAVDRLDVFEVGPVAAAVEPFVDQAMDC